MPTATAAAGVASLINQFLILSNPELILVTISGSPQAQKEVGKYKIKNIKKSFFHINHSFLNII